MYNDLPIKYLPNNIVLVITKSINESVNINNKSSCTQGSIGQ